MASYVQEKSREVKEGVRQALAGDALGRKGETAESIGVAAGRGRAAARGGESRGGEAAGARGIRSIDRRPFLALAGAVAWLACFRVQFAMACRGRAATENIYGKAGGAMDAFGEKMVMPEDVVEQKRAEAAGGGGDGGAAGEAGEDVMLRVKAADQMTGQAFNDVGLMGEEGLRDTAARPAELTSAGVMFRRFVVY